MTGSFPAMSDAIAAICLRAAGYLQLGMPEDCLAELDELPTATAEAIHLRVAALFELERWDQAVGICLPMLARQPEESAWWVQAAYAMRRARTLSEAEPILRAALDHHPGHFLICYNLACYACVQNRLDEAREFLSHSLKAHPSEALAMALKDDDLAAIRPWLQDLATAGEIS
jgi:tetratricopeptide (TPR) repeat protein